MLMHEGEKKKKKKGKLVYNDLWNANSEYIYNSFVSSALDEKQH